MPLEDEFGTPPLSATEDPVVETPEEPQEPTQPTIDPNEYAQLKAERDQFLREKQEREDAERQRLAREDQAKTAAKMKDERFQTKFKKLAELANLRLAAEEAWKAGDPNASSLFLQYAQEQDRYDEEAAEALIKRNMGALNEIIQQQNTISANANQFVQAIKSDPRLADIHDAADALGLLETKILSGNMTRADLLELAKQIKGGQGTAQTATGKPKLGVVPGGHGRKNIQMEGMSDGGLPDDYDTKTEDKAIRRIVRGIMDG